MKYEHREYQETSENLLLTSILENKENHPVVALPTGSGKTKVLLGFIEKYLKVKPNDCILIISHTETIVKQDFEAIVDYFPKENVGLYSAGLDSKTIERLTVAGIQSIYKYPHHFDFFHIVIVDECHAVPSRGEGMYRKFFKEVKCQRIGLSGTPFRTSTGYVHKGKGALFNKLVIDLTAGEKFNKLITDGYLTDLYCKPPDLQLSVKGVKTSAGDFNLKDLSKNIDRKAITDKAIKELLFFGKNYKSWLIFAIDIEHANHINEQLQASSIASVALHTKAGVDRKEIIDQFKSFQLRSIVSVGMITTGFDAPNIDLIALLRPTKSPGLHIQMIGRGSRIYPGKTHCLVLDYAGNVKRLGPINAVVVPDGKKKKRGVKQILVKPCEVCGCLHHLKVKVCNVCGFEFKFQEKITSKFNDNKVIQKEFKQEEWLKVSYVDFHIHKKKDRPNSLRVCYFCGSLAFNEYICYDHTGFAKVKAIKWVKEHWTYHVWPKDVNELYTYKHLLRIPRMIKVDLSKKYPDIIDNLY